MSKGSKDADEKGRGKGDTFEGRMQDGERCVSIDVDLHVNKETKLLCKSIFRG